MERATTLAQRNINTSGQRDLALELIGQALKNNKASFFLNLTFYGEIRKYEFFD